MAGSYRSRALVLAASVGLIAACTGKDPTRPGDSIGIFTVTGALVASSCGATPNPWTFTVHLRHDGTTLYWVQGTQPISAPVDSAAYAALTTSTTDTVRDATSTLAACAMERDDTVDVTLAGVTYGAKDISPATSFTGTLAYHFSVVSGTDCSDQLAAVGGDYAALPCDISYTLTATKTGDAN